MASNLVHHGQSFDDQPLGFGTLAIHLGNGVDAETGAIRRPITLANTYALPYDATDHDGHNRFVSKLNVITSAVSLGHDQSLIVFLGEDDERQYLYPPEFHRGFFRLAVGLEDTDDLIRDIDHALAEAGFEV